MSTALTTRWVTCRGCLERTTRKTARNHSGYCKPCYSIAWKVGRLFAAVQSLGTAEAELREASMPDCADKIKAERDELRGVCLAFAKAVKWNAEQLQRIEEV